uniref:Tudor domain-containing protein 1 n=1 Tax=Glossina pallidipes TaxID=7398 RepID=A0A1B0AGF4_GLOPL
MEKNFKSAEFNQYIPVTGGNLVDNSQSKPNANKKGHYSPYLVFKNVPKGMTKLTLRNICSKNGLVRDVRHDNKSGCYFVDFATVVDAEAVCQSLQNNMLGFQVVVGKKKNVTSAPIRPDDKLPLTTQSTQRENLACLSSDKLLPHDVHKDNTSACTDSGGAYITVPDKMKTSEEIGTHTKEEFTRKKIWLENNQCILCRRECHLVCRRCRGYYCSVECQKRDWEKHRYICGKPRRSLQLSKIKAANDNQKDNVDVVSHASLNRSVEKQEKSDYTALIKQMPRSGSIVTITAIMKSNVVFIRCKDYDDNENFCKTVSGLQKLGESLKMAIGKPRCGQIFISKFRDQFCRVMILNHTENEDVDVAYIDYGNVDTLNLKDLYEAPDLYTRIPRYALPVILKDVPDCYMTEEIGKLMYSYLNKNVYLKYEPENFITENGVYMVELIEESMRQNFNTALKDLAIPREPLNSSEICFKDYLKHVLLPSGDNIELVVMDTSLMHTGVISCTTKPYAMKIQKFTRDIQKYAQNVSTARYTPQLNELCIAKYNVDDAWYRGCCLKVHGRGEAFIMFIDYNSIECVEVENIRPYPLQFTYPIYTSDCEIRGKSASTMQRGGGGKIEGTYTQWGYTKV